MLLFYLDASAWAKRYTGEYGWDVVNALFDDPAINGKIGLITSTLSQAEVTSAFVRFRNRTGLSDDRFDEGLHQLSVDGERLYWLRIGDETFRHGIPLVIKHSINATDGAILRGLLDLRDQLHSSGNRVWLVTSDKRLVRAASLEGVPCLDPEIDSLRAVRQLLADH